MKLSRLDSRRALALLLAIASVLASACVKAGDAGVKVSALNADVVFGVKPVEETEAASPNTDLGSGNAAAGAVEGEGDIDLLPPQVVEPSRPKNFPRPSFENTTPVAEICPAARVDEFPEETAPLNVPADRQAEVGLYRWKRSGSISSPQGPIPVGDFEQRAIRNFVKEGADPANAARVRFNYDFVQAEPGSNNVVTSKIRVDTAAQSAQQESTLGPERVIVGEPERGVVLKSVRRTDSAGNRAGGDFNPSTGLLLLPLPIRTGEQFTSVAVDTQTQQTYRYEATVVKRDRVDACGKILEGWRVNGTRTTSGPNGTTEKYNTIIAPQFGGAILYEYQEGTTAKGVSYKFEFTIGQQKPDPFPPA